MLQIVPKAALDNCQAGVQEEQSYILLFVICRMEEELEEPMSHNVVPTSDVPAVLVSVCE